jgi:3',5'-cyclic AMP phosphodiesterase CpdA
MSKKTLFVAIIPLLAISLSGCSSTSSPSLDDYVSELGYEDGFTILQWTDLHWSIETDREEEKRYLSAAFEAAKEASPSKRIDLLMITGDLALISSKSVLEDEFSFIRSLNVPFGVSWGNHDKQGTYSLSYLDSLASSGQSIYKNVDDDVHGRSNYVVNIMDGNTVKWQVFSLDSNSYEPSGALYSYDYIHDDQVEWFKEESKDVPSLCYFHIPLLEWGDSKNDTTGLKSKEKWEEYEKECPSPKRSKLFEEAKKSGVQGMFCGHYHSNDYVSTYDGVVLGYGVKTGKELYYAHSSTRDIDLIGGSLVILHDDSFELKHVYTQDTDGYPSYTENY